MALILKWLFPERDLGPRRGGHHLNNRRWLRRIPNTNIFKDRVQQKLVSDSTFGLV